MAPERLPDTWTRRCVLLGREVNGTFTATLTVTDIWRATAVGTAQVTVSNVAVTVTALEVPVEPVVIAETVTISVTYGDPGAADTHTVEIAWGDSVVDSGAAPVVVVPFLTAGTFIRPWCPVA